MATVTPPEKTALYVGDLDATVNEEDLERTLGYFGTIISTRVCRDRNTGKSLRYAYVNFSSHCSAESALQMMNHVVLKGRPMRIMWTDRNPIGRKNGLGNVFVKNLDESIGGLELEFLFSPYGRVDSCKVQLDENGRSRGFGFVQMNTEEAAQSAIAALHGTVPPGARKKLYVAKFVRKCERQALPQHSQVFCNLYIKNLEKDFTDDSLKQKFSEYGKVNSAVIMKNENGNSRGFGFVSFESPEDAKKAMEAMNGSILGSKTIYVGPARTKAHREEQIKMHFGNSNPPGLKKTQGGTTVFVRNIDDSVTDEALQEHFASCGKILWLKASRFSNGQNKGYGFVCFASLEEANRAVAIVNGSKLNGKLLYVTIAQNRENRCKISQGQPVFTSNYQSVWNQGFGYPSAPSAYLRSSNVIPLQRPPCNAHFNSQLHPMMVYLPQESYYMQGRYGDEYCLNQRYIQPPPRYEKGMKKTHHPQLQVPSGSGAKKMSSKISILSKLDLIEPQLRKSKILEFLYCNIPMLEPKNALEIANKMISMNSTKLHEFLSKPKGLNQLVMEATNKALGVEDGVDASTAVVTEN
ncbi:Polyadenylate-binding protein 2 [Platanthera guangdongensis]|uniref:Polyadenylate-binding protein 2 n=1 Tax=Platanthera guangdongensis TaxID=2320717 RepID=A0ABR2M3K5_9ASPA